MAASNVLGSMGTGAAAGASFGPYGTGCHRRQDTFVAQYVATFDHLDKWRERNGLRCIAQNFGAVEAGELGRVRL